jgi:hypothetical protein
MGGIVATIGRIATGERRAVVRYRPAADMDCRVVMRMRASHDAG